MGCNCGGGSHTEIKPKGVLAQAKTIVQEKPKKAVVPKKVNNTKKATTLLTVRKT